MSTIRRGDQDQDQDHEASTEDLLLDLRAGVTMLGRALEAKDIDRYGEFDSEQYRQRFSSITQSHDEAGIDPDTGEIVEPLADVLGVDGGESA